MPMQPNGRWRVDPRPCLICRTVFRPSAGNDRKGYGVYCSQACSGIAKSSIPLSDRVWPRVDKTAACWLYTGKLSPKGYGIVSVTKNKTVQAHRLAWEWAAGPIPDGMQVNHVCDVRNCIRNDDSGIYPLNGVDHPRRGHLWLGTSAENSLDMTDKGRSTYGARNPNAKLTDAEVSAIRREYANGGVRHLDIAIRYGVSPSLISYVVRRKGWTHVP